MAAAVVMSVQNPKTRIAASTAPISRGLRPPTTSPPPAARASATAMHAPTVYIATLNVALARGRRSLQFSTTAPAATLSTTQPGGSSNSPAASPASVQVKLIFALPPRSFIQGDAAIANSPVASPTSHQPEGRGPAAAATPAATIPGAATNTMNATYQRRGVRSLSVGVIDAPMLALPVIGSD